MSRGLPERQLEIEGLLKDLEHLQGQMGELSAWATNTRTTLEQSPEEPPAKVGYISSKMILHLSFVYPDPTQQKTKANSFLLYFLQVNEEVRAKEPIIESVLNRADQLYKDNPPNQPDKVSKSNVLKIKFNFLH